MLKIYLPILLSFLCFSTQLSADHEEGEELFHDASCMSCHNDEDFGAKKKIQGFKKLYKAVDACRFANDAEWFDDESAEVAEYLNDKYYKFDTQK